MTKTKNEVHKSTDQTSREKGIPVDPWGVLELFESLMTEADEIVKKYKKED